MILSSTDKDHFFVFYVLTIGGDFMNHFTENKIKALNLFFMKSIIM